MAAEDTHAANGALAANHKRGRAQLTENMMDHESPMSLLAVAAMAAEDDPQNSGSEEEDGHQGDGEGGRDGRTSAQKKNMPVRSSSFGRRIRPKYASEESDDDYIEEEEDEEDAQGGIRPYRGVSRYRPDDEDEYDEDDGREYRSVAGSRGVSPSEYEGQYMVDDDDEEYEEVSGSLSGCNLVVGIRLARVSVGIRFHQLVCD